jgi:hypothetical protein
LAGRLSGNEYRLDLDLTQIALRIAKPLRKEVNNCQMGT